MIKLITKVLLNPKAALYFACKNYIKKYEGFSYDFSKNGEAFVVDALSNHIAAGVIFDVGANKGDWSRMSSEKFPECAIYSFEPSPSTFKDFLETSTFSISSIKCYNIGLGSESAILPFKEYQGGNIFSTFVIDADFHSLKTSTTNVEVTTGDKFCQTNKIKKISFLKIDVEGFEYDVIKGFGEMIANSNIDVIQFEYGYTNADAGHTLKDIYKLLSDNDYVVGPLKPKGVIFMEFDYALNNFNSGPNFIAVSKKAPHLIDAIQGPGIKYYPMR